MKRLLTLSLSLCLLLLCACAPSETDTPSNVAPPAQEYVHNAALGGEMRTIDGTSFSFDDPQNALLVDQVTGLGIKWPQPMLDYAAQYILLPIGLDGFGTSLNLSSEALLLDDAGALTFAEGSLIELLGFYVLEEGVPLDEHPFASLAGDAFSVEHLATVDTLSYYFSARKNLDDLTLEPDTAAFAAQLLELAEQIKLGAFFFPANADAGSLDLSEPPTGSADLIAPFATETMDGTPVDESIFSDYDVTMINIWATWCPPCIEEMPLLEQVYQGLPDGANMITICDDAATQTDLALDILTQSGATFDTLVGNDTLYAPLMSRVQAFPTTVFVDSSGALIGEAIVGVPHDAVASYLATIEALLPADNG